MGSDPQQQFCLRWHNYQNSFLATLPQLLDGDDLTDVTLCAGGRSIKAHRIVLSACSQYFKDIFRELQPMQHPVIVLPGTEFSDLCALVTFMYSGEVNIYQHQLPGLLAMADTLHIRGLAEFTPSANQFENGSRLAVKQENERRGEISESSRCKRAKLSEPMVGEGLSKGGTCVKKERGGGRGGARGPLQDEDMAEDLSKRHDPDPASLPTDLSQGETSVRSQSKLYATCFVCGKQLSNQYNLRVHMETHQNAHYACTSCNHVSRSRDALRKHVSYRHPGTPTDMAKKLPNT